MTILWLTPKSGANPTFRGIINSALAKAGVMQGSIIFTSLHTKSPILAEHDPGKMPDKIAIAQALKVLDTFIEQLQPKLMVINDEDTLRAITGEKYTLATTRGSLYWRKNIPILVIDQFNSVRFKKYGRFVYELDLSKIARWVTGKQKNEPAFTYVLCKTVGEVLEQTQAASASCIIATDRETAFGFITCTSYTYFTREGKTVTFVIPFYDPTKENGCFWTEEKDEITVHKAIRELNANPKVVKCFQNGTYDCAYDILYGMENTNYIVDTANLMHSIWCEAPKALHNIASYFVDHYTYWKDENKGAKEDGFGRSIEDLKRYWRYNGLDSYYTLLSAVALLGRIVQLPWALSNYSMEFGLSVGPCLEASLTGIKVNDDRHRQLMLEQSKMANAGEIDLRCLSGENDFNIGSTKDIGWLLYDVLGAQKTRLQRKGSKYGARSTDEKVLKLMKEQRNFFVSHTIDRILRAKKPVTWISKYGNFKKLTYHGRFLSWHNAAGTETFRFNSGGSQFWTGTNGQNWQPYTQEILVADPDFVLVDCDYSASDDWFVAYEAQDDVKIQNLKTKDVHSYHASVFFKKNYEDIIRSKKNHEDWVVHPITGVRQISKKVAHGRNFRMGAEMLYNLAGRDMIVATAKFMGYTNAEGMSDKELIGICSLLGDLYDHPKRGMYKCIRPWQEETTEELRKNGGLFTNCHGITRKFLGDPNDHSVQRELSSQYGQSGTSGNINRALRTLYYNDIINGKTIIFILQVHDSLKFLIHKSELHVIPKIKEVMEKEIIIKGRNFFVPVNIEVGLTDGKKMLPWRPEITYTEIVAHEEATYAKKFPKGIDAFIESLSKADFGGGENSNATELAEFEQQEDGLDQNSDELEFAEIEE